MENNDTNSKLPSTVPAITRLLNIFGDSIHFYPFQVATSDPGGPVSFVLRTVLNQNNINEFLQPSKVFPISLFGFLLIGMMFTAIVAVSNHILNG